MFNNMTNKQYDLLKELEVVFEKINIECKADTNFKKFIAGLYIFDEASFKHDEIEGILEDNLNPPQM